MDYYYGNERVHDDEPKKKNKGCVISVIIILILMFIVPLSSLIFMAVISPNHLGFGRDKIINLSGTEMSLDDAGLGDKSLLYLSRVVVAFTKNPKPASFVDNAFNSDDLKSVKDKLSCTSKPLKRKTDYIIPVQPGYITVSDRELAAAMNEISQTILIDAGYGNNFVLRIEQIKIAVSSNSIKKINVVLFVDISEIIEDFKSTLPVRIDITSKLYISQTMQLIDTADGLKFDAPELSINGLDGDASIAVIKLIEGDHDMKLNNALMNFLLDNFASLNAKFENFRNGEIRLY